MSEIVDVRQFRSKWEVNVELGGGLGHIVVRKQDMTLLLMNGKVPMPVLAAVQRMIDMPDVATDAERLAVLVQDEQGDSLVNMLHEHACAVALKPRLTMGYTEEPGTLPVTYLNLPQLMAIWTATAVVPKVTTAEAGRFRFATDADAPPVVADEPSIPAPAEQLVVPDTDVVSH